MIEDADPYGLNAASQQDVVAAPPVAIDSDPYGLMAAQTHNNIVPDSEEKKKDFPQDAQAPVSTMLNAPFSGLLNSGVNAALGGTQAIAGGLNAIGVLPDALNIGGSDYGYKAGNQGINDIKSIIDQQNADAMAGNVPAKVMNTGGEIAGNMALFAGTGGTNPGYAAPIASGMITGGAQPADNQIDRLKNAAISGGAALGGKVLGDIISPQVSDQTKQAALQTAKDFDIPIYRSQVSDSPVVKAAASFEKDVPFSGATGKVSDQVSAFNRAVNGTIGQTGDAVTPETLKDADKQIGDIYDKMTGKYNLKVTPDFEDKLLQLNDSAKFLGDQNKSYALQNQVDNVMSKIRNDQIGGSTYQGIRSQIGGLLRGQNGSPELGQLQDLLDSQFQQGMNVRDLTEFQTARSQYRNMLALEKVVANSPNEPISPAKLQGAVKNVFGNYAYAGGSDLERLARLGNILKDTFPNSGTATRAQLYDIAKHVAGPVIGMGIGGAEGYHQGGTAGALAGAAGGLALNRMALTPFLYTKMSQNPALIQQLLPEISAAAPFSFSPLTQGAK